MAHHPVEYMAAILTSVKDDKDRKPYYLYACRGMGIEVLPPDVNESDMDFAPAPGDRRAIRYGLSAVRNVGEGAVARRSSRRARPGGPFASFADFCRRVEPSVLTKRVLESLDLRGRVRLARLRAGRHGPDRGRAARVREGVGPHPRRAQGRGRGPVLAVRRRRRRTTASTRSTSPSSQGPEMDKRLLLSKEKEMLGQFVTDHPLLGIEGTLGGAVHARHPRRSRTSATATWSRSAGSSARSPGSTRSVASRTRSSGWRGSRAGSRWWPSPASTRPCPS